MTDDEFFDLPADPGAEVGVLGAAMLSDDAAADVVEALSAQDFTVGAHKIVFEGIERLLQSGQSTDPLTLKSDLERRGELEKIRNAVTLTDLVAQVPTATNVAYWIDQIREASGTRHGMAAGAQITRIFAHRDLDLEERIEAARHALDTASGIVETQTGQPLADMIPGFLDRLEGGHETAGVTTGWQDLDQLLVKLRPGQLITVGARPGIGKTVVLLNIGLHVALRLGQPVLFSSLEMGAEEILFRVFAHEARVPLNIMQSGQLTEAHWAQLAKAAANMASSSNLLIEDGTATTVGHIRAKLRSMRRAGQPAAVCLIDYLQLMSSPKKTESRQQEVSSISRDLKLLAKDMGLPIVVAAQLNRGPEQRSNKRPALSDLRESGAVEQDSDVVILLHREDAYEKESPKAGEIDLIVAKHRQGPTATITAAFQGHYSKIADMAPDPNPYIPPPSWGRDAYTGNDERE